MRSQICFKNFNSKQEIGEASMKSLDYPDDRYMD